MLGRGLTQHVISMPPGHIGRQTLNLYSLTCGNLYRMGHSDSFFSGFVRVRFWMNHWRMSAFGTPPQAKALSIMPSKAKERAERLFQWKQEGVKAASEYEAKEQATRLLTTKLRAERLVREATSRKRDQTKAPKA